MFSLAPPDMHQRRGPRRPFDTRQRGSWEFVCGVQIPARETAETAACCEIPAAPHA